MKSIFPKYLLSCRPECSEQEIIERIEKGVEYYKYRFRIKSKSMQNPRFTIASGTGSRFYYNSFMPMITIDIIDSEVSITAQLQKSIKITFWIFISLCILFALPSFFFVDIRAIAFSSLLLLGFAVFAYILSVFGLKYSSRGVLKDFYEMINLEYPTTNITITRL